MMGGHLRHIRFDIAVMLDETPGYSDPLFTVPEAPPTWDISVILSNGEHGQINKQSLYWDSHYFVDSVCDDGFPPRENNPLASQSSIRYVSIDWSHRTPDKGLRNWMDCLQDNHWLGFQIFNWSSGDRSVTLRELRIRGEIYYSYN
ncbi:hypothetical protein BDZ91DRAFT_726694 [Kalaharituber pfeilii]|nr:hypothetical protein BDZ91DRAFT_726694 [Kalaharituber pfeilii]